MRWLLLLSTVPIAIVANASRIVFTGVVGHYSPELADGFLHAFSGWVIFIMALAIFMLMHKLLGTVYRHVQR
jgi:exosortase/archaeosortase family protein